jgi:tetraprenyl-beta-curcumene synthase
VYWLEAFSAARRELHAWRRRAEAIPDPDLRRHALGALRAKAGHSEGAAAFATLVPRPCRRRFVRLAIAYQTMVDYLDTISELPADDPFANTVRLHGALLGALDLDSPADDDYYEMSPRNDDGGYLSAHVATCRQALARLPSHLAVSEGLCRFTSLYIEAEGLCHAIEAGKGETAAAERTQVEAERWRELQWGELIAAGSSSLPVLALMAAAAAPATSKPHGELLGAAYYPWTSALHILLHGLVDQAEDRRNGQFNQLYHYRSTDETGERLALVASRARQLVCMVPDGDMHAVLLAGMVGYYLAPPHVWEGENADIACGVLESLGPLVRPALLVHRIRRGELRSALPGRHGPLARPRTTSV